MKNPSILHCAALTCAFALTASASLADQVYIDDVIVMGSLCTGTGCTDNMDFGFDTVAVTGDTSSILFQDTSSFAEFPRQDWRVGVGGTADSGFYIENVDSATTVFGATGGPDGGVALGSDSTIVDGAISVGSVGNLRKVVNVADGTEATDAVTYGQFSAQIGTTISDLNSFYATEITAQAARLNDLDQRIDSVGAIGAAMSALVINPRAGGNNQLSFGMGNYGSETALALGGVISATTGPICLMSGFRAARRAGRWPIGPV